MSDEVERVARPDAGPPEAPARVRVACAVFVSCVLLVATFFGLSRDVLFFATPWPLAVYAVVAAGGLVALATAPLLALGLLLPSALRTKLAAVVVASTPALLLAGFMLFAVESIREFSSLGGVFMAWLASLAAASALLSRGSGRHEALARASALTVALAGAGAAVVVVGLVASHATARRDATTPERHVVLVVIDGMPSQLLQNYNPGAPRTELDAVAERGRIFTAARTNFTYTNGFFSTLYRGHLRGDKQVEGPHLLEELRHAGVSTRWLTYHTNGVPEARSIWDYGGLRSVLLTEQLAWWPRLLGVNYHTFLRCQRTALWLHPRLKAAYQLLHGRRLFDQQSFLDHFLLGQIREVRLRARRSFLLAHVPVGASVDVQAAEEGLHREDRPEFAELVEEAMDQEYRYDPRSQHLVDGFREHVRASMNVWARGLGALLDALAAEGLDQETLVVVTSDHGQMFSKGKLFYGYHPDEQVARVPLLVFGPGLSGTESRAVDTLDVVRTIEEFLGSPSPLSRTGRNLLGDFDDRYVPTLTTHAKKRQERFLVVYDRGRKHVANLEGADAPITGVTRGYELEEQRSLRPDEPYMQLLRQAALQYGIKTVPTPL